MMQPGEERAYECRLVAQQDLKRRHYKLARIGLLATIVELILATSSALLEQHAYSLIDRQQVSALVRDPAFLASRWLQGAEPVVHAVSFAILTWMFIPTSAAMAWIGLCAALGVDLACLVTSAVLLFPKIPQAFGSATTVQVVAGDQSSMFMLTLDLFSTLLSFVGYLFIGLAVLSGPFRSRLLAGFFFFGVAYALFSLATFDLKEPLLGFLNDSVYPAVLILERVAIIFWFLGVMKKLRQPAFVWGGTFTGN